MFFRRASSASTACSSSHRASVTLPRYFSPWISGTIRFASSGSVARRPLKSELCDAANVISCVDTVSSSWSLASSASRSERDLPAFSAS